MAAKKSASKITQNTKKKNVNNLPKFITDAMAKKAKKK
jgi:hypothetical protein